MKVDLVIRNALVEERGDLFDIAVRDGRIAAIAPRFACEAVEEVDARGAFAFGGFVDSHVHLDKACILDRCTICEGTLAEAIGETAKAKAGFDEADVYRRAARVVELAIGHGTTRMRTFVEIDPRAGFRSFAAIKRIRADYAFALDIEICAFSQDGLTNEPESLDMLDRALSDGADLVGGCPYMDPDPDRHIEMIFDLAARHDVDVDFHLDFDLDPAHTSLPAVIARTMRHGWQGRVSIGHVTNISAMTPAEADAVAGRLAEAGIALTVLPATDLFLNGRGHDRLVPRGVTPAHRFQAAGVTAAIATNNVLNPFTPFGDASLVRMANLYANIAQISRPADLETVFGMVSHAAARAMNAPHGLRVGADADIVLMDCAGPLSAIREIAPVLAGWKRGARSFDNGRRVIHRPQQADERN